MSRNLLAAVAAVVVLLTSLGCSCLLLADPPDSCTVTRTNDPATPRPTPALQPVR